MAYSKDYKDDPTITDGDRLWRRLHPSQMTFDENLQRRRPSSAAFSDSSDGTAMSVSIVKLRPSDDPDVLVSEHPGEGIAEFTAGFARGLNQGVEHTPDEGGPDHGSVWDRKGNRSSGTRSKLAKGCEVLREPAPHVEPRNPEHDTP